MNKLMIALVIFLIVLAVSLFGLYGGLVYKNNKALPNTMLKTFLMYIPDELGMGDNSVSWSSGSLGSEPISCPAGYEINIIDAVFEPYDPERNLTDTCQTGKFCLPKPTAPNTAEYSGTDKIVKDGKEYYCKIQDSSPYLSAFCNGKETCPITNLDFSTAFGNPPVSNVTPDDASSLLPDNGTNNKFYVHGVYTCTLKN